MVGARLTPPLWCHCVVLLRVCALCWCCRSCICASLGHDVGVRHTWHLAPSMPWQWRQSKSRSRCDIARLPTFPPPRMWQRDVSTASRRGLLAEDHLDLAGWCSRLEGRCGLHSTSASRSVRQALSTPGTEWDIC